MNIPTVADLKAVCGDDISTEEASKCLRHSKYDLAAAINYYFDSRKTSVLSRVPSKAPKRCRNQVICLDDDELSSEKEDPILDVNPSPKVEQVTQEKQIVSQIAQTKPAFFQPPFKLPKSSPNISSPYSPSSPILPHEPISLPTLFTSATVFDSAQIVPLTTLSTNVVITSSFSKKQSQRQAHTLPIKDNKLRTKLLEEARSTAVIRVGIADSSSRTTYIAKLQSKLAQSLWPLLAVDFLKICVRTAESQESESFEFGESVNLEIDLSLLPDAFRYSVRGIDALAPVAQGRLRDSMVDLFTHILRLTPTTSSLLRGDNGTIAETTVTSLPDEVETGGDYSQESIQKTGAVFDGSELTGDVDHKFKVHPVTPLSTAFNGVLRRYQEEGLGWSLVREQESRNDSKTTVNPLWDEYQINGRSLYVNQATGELSIRLPPVDNDCRGGILADEMGLGKTIQIVSLIAHDLHCNESKQMRPRNTQIRGGTLIVVPLSLLGQWRAEIERYLILPPSYDPKEKCTLYYGASRGVERSARQLASWPVVLTTYATIGAEYAKKGSEKLSALWQITWYRIVLDECHNIRNRETRQTRAITSLNGERKWCLSGTPIQNSLEDLFPLFQFLGVHPWDQWVWWSRFVSGPLSKGQEAQATATVRRITEPLLLRRTKQTIDPSTGLPIVTLPPINIVNITLQLSKQEKTFYDFLFQKSKSEFDAYLHLGLVGKNYTHILALLMKLRQACCHPLLALSNSGIKDAKNFDGLEEAIWKYQAKHGNTALSKEFVDGQLQQWRSGCVNECVVCQDDESMDPVVSLPCCHVMCRECAINSVKALASCPVCRVGLTLKALIGFPRNSATFGCSRTALLQKFACQSDDVDALPNEIQGDTSGQVFVMKRDDGFDLSSKLLLLREMLAAHIEKGCDVVVFSQWTSFLDLIEEVFKHSQSNGLDTVSGISWVCSRFASLDVKDPISREELSDGTDYTLLPGIEVCGPQENEWRYRRLDGSMSLKQRNEAINWFTYKEGNQDKGQILLCSLAVGGVGLNLVSAAHVYILDPWWNPAMESQAYQRVYRIGQTKEVFVYRFIVQDTVEKSILDLHEKKNRKADSILSTKTNSETHRKFTGLEDLKAIFSNS